MDRTGYSKDLKTKENSIRPIYLTIISIGLLLWGIVLILMISDEILSISRFAKESFFPVINILVIIFMWISIAIAGIGIFRGARWSRTLLVAALIVLYIATTFSPYHDDDYPVSKFIFYAVLIWSVYTRRSNVYFKKNKKNDT